MEVELARRGENLPDVVLEAEAGGSEPVVWLGDSTAYGVGVERASEAVPGRVAARRDERVTNLAVSGATVDDVVDRQLARLEGVSLRRIYVSVGANDVTHLTSRRRFERSYRALLDGLPAGVPVVVLGVPDMGAPPRLAQPLRAVAGFRGRHLDAIVRSVAGERPRTTDLDIAGPTGPPFRRDPDRYFAADGYHPSAAGYALWAEAVLARVSP